MTVKKALIMFFVSAILLTSCKLPKTGEGQNNPVEVKKPQILDVFIVSDAVHEYYESENRENVYYTTLTSIGDFDFVPTKFGHAGFIYVDALEKFQKETGTKLNITWFQYADEMEAHLETLDQSQMPDVILNNFSTYEDYYLYMDQGWFYDLNAFFEKNEIYSGGKYNNQVLRGGQLHQSQYIVPLLYNIDTIMGSKEKWDNLGLYLQQTETHSEMLDALIYAQNEEGVDQLAIQLLNQPFFMLHSVYLSSGEQWIDYEEKTVNLDQELFNRMCRFYEQFLDEQLPLLKEDEEPNWYESKHMQMFIAIKNDVQISEFIDDVGCFVEGGGAFQVSLHSAPVQAWYFESRYEDQNETFQIVPLVGENGGTTAHISYFGAVMSASEHPETAFEFLHYLMDVEVDPLFGMPINQANLEKQLDYYTNSAYKLRPGLLVPLKDGKLADSSADYVMQPMSRETSEQLKEMTENIGAATMPNWPVYAILQEQLESYAVGEIIMEEAYENSLNGLKQYVETEGGMKP